MKIEIVILGAGESGVGAACLSSKKGFNTFVSDINPIKKHYKDLLYSYNINFEENKHSKEKILKADLIIKSPGIDPNNELILEAKKKGIQIISEIEFAYWFCNAKIIAITGSNGKTTTTTLIYEILKKANLNVGLAGNIGNSFAFSVLNNNFNYYVLEVSSFQLEDIDKFKPHIAILLNISQNHLNRYQYIFEKYVKAKFNIIKNQTSNDYFIYCYDDKIIQSQLKSVQVKSKLVPFSQKIKIKYGGYIEDNHLKIKLNKKSFCMDLKELTLPGRHNKYNSLAASLAAKISDIRNETIKAVLRNFHPLEHRMESVAKIRGVEFINDSKATTVHATWYALEYYNRPIIWLVGGLDKGNDYSLIYDLVKKKVKAIICIGLDNSKIINAFKNLNKRIYEIKDMKKAVSLAFRISEPNDIVLLSPACASFDLYENYEDRGNQFKKAVKEL